MVTSLVEERLHLSYQDLNELYWNDGSDVEEAQVINSVLSFENCAAHVGDRGWGNYLWNDLQGRVYITDLTPEEVAARVEKQGRDKASKVFERASVISGNHGKWEKRTLDILDAPSGSDLILGKNLDFYIGLSVTEQLYLFSYTRIASITKLIYY